jgi:hypothetical protein
MPRPHRRGRPARARPAVAAAAPDLRRRQPRRQLVGHGCAASRRSAPPRCGWWPSSPPRAYRPRSRAPSRSLRRVLSGAADTWSCAPYGSLRRSPRRQRRLRCRHGRGVRGHGSHQCRVASVHRGSSRRLGGFRAGMSTTTIAPILLPSHPSNTLVSATRVGQGSPTRPLSAIVHRTADRAGPT